MPSGSSSLPSNKSFSLYSFEEFLRGWYHRLEQLLVDIAAAVDTKNSEEVHIEDMEARQLIARALHHFEEYYEQQSRAAHLNVFALFSPTWCSSFECAFLWIAGFQPRVLLRLVSDSVRDLSSHQIQTLERLKSETRIKEKAVEDELARVQETTVAPPLMDVLRKAAWLNEEQSFRLKSEHVEQLQMALEVVIAEADALRVATGAKVAEILRPIQCLRFLVAALRLMQGMRSLGMQRDLLAGQR